MIVSLVITVFNEEKSIKKLLKSLVNQTKRPDEIVIVDGGSTDNTLSMIYDFAYSIHNKKILVKVASSIAEGRNYGIQNASGDVIVMTDAGCVAHRDWLEKITEPFEKKDADMVAGFYCMKGSRSLQKALAVFLGISPQRFDSNEFLPSARSMAFKKPLWEKIGGFEERLEKAGEDTLFNYQAIRVGARFVRVKDALVDWEVPESLWEGVKKFYTYSKGDVQAGIWWHPGQRISTHNLKIASIFIRYFIGFLLLFLSFRFHWILYFLFVFFLLYLFWSIWKMRDVVTDTKAQLWLPVIQILSDLAVLAGTIAGFLGYLTK